MLLPLLVVTQAAIATLLGRIVTFFSNRSSSTTRWSRPAHRSGGIALGVGLHPGCRSLRICPIWGVLRTLLDPCCAAAGGFAVARLSRGASSAECHSPMPLPMTALGNARNFRMAAIRLVEQSELFRRYH